MVSGPSLFDEIVILLNHSTTHVDLCLILLNDYMFIID